MISPTADAGSTPTQRTTPPIETFLRVIVLSFVALTLFAIPREGAVQPPAATRVIVGSGIGGQSKVRVFDGTTAAPLPPPLGSFTALTQNPGGEVRVAACDFNSDGTDDIIATPGLGKRAEVRVFNGVTGLPFPPPLGSFLAFGSGFLGGVHVACGDLTGDSIPDIIAARGAVAKPEVRVFNGVTAAPLPPPFGSFFAFNQTFLGGVRVAACDLNQDGKTDIVAARGPLAQPEIRAFDGLTGNVFPPPLGSFLAFSASDRGGVYVACGDLTGDTIPDIIAGKGAGQPPAVRVFNGVTAAPLPPPFGSFNAFNSTFLGGVRVASCDLNQDGRNDIIAGRGPGAQPEVRAFDGVSGTPFPGPMGSFLAFGATFKGGVYVACSPSESGGGPPPADTAPSVTSTIPTNGATGVTTNSNLTITFSEPVAVAGDWFQISCPTSGPRNVTLANTVVTGGPTTFTINPNTDFAPNEICSTTIVAAQVTDLDSNDPPNNMAADFTFGFTTEAAPFVSSTVPTNGATGVAVGSDITVSFSEPVTTTASTFGLECPAGTPIPFVVSPAPPGNTTSYTLNPNADLPAGTCTIKVTATQVTDVDTNDPPDTMVTDFTSTFTSGANNPPSFVVGPNQTVGENAGPQTVSPWATAIDDGDPAVTQALTFNITGNTNPSLFSAGPSVSPTGVLTYTPATNQSGTASITLTLTDDGGTPGTPGDDATSPPQTFTITVNAVNNPPTFVAGPDQSVNEDSAAQTVSPWATGIDDGDPESTQTVMFNITNNTNTGLFSAGPSVSPSGVLTYTPAANAFGSATITLVLQDNGGTANPGDDDTSPPQSFTITINAVNDPPSFTAGPSQNVLEDSGAVTVSPWATAISPGPANESGQTVSFNITGNSNPGLFSLGPNVSPAGVLTFTPAANAFGNATINLVIQDSGGGTDTSAPQGFSITVTAVNDPPVATAKSHQTHSGIRITIGASDTGKLKDGATDVDDPFSSLSVSALFSASTPAGATITLTDAATGTFTFNPPAGVSGLVTFQYTVCDVGTTAPPAMCSAPATVSFNVTGPDLWFVQQGASGTGRLTDPFGTLASLPAGRGNTDRIFVFTGTYPTGLTLLTAEHLIGQGSSGSFDSVLGVTVPVNGTLDTRPTLAGTLAARPQLNGTVTVGGSSVVRGLNIASTTATGLAGGAVVGVNVSEASVTSTTGTAVDLNGTGGTVGLTAVSANGGSNGIVLNNTGASSSFTVTGTGTAGSGGTIQNKATGISLTNANNVSLTRMQLNDFTDFAIRGSSVVGFTMDNTVINGTNGDNAGADEGSVRFTGLTGSAAISNSSVSGTVENNFTVINTAGTLNRITFTNVTFGSMSAATGDHALLIESLNSAVINTSVLNSTFTAARGTHINRVLNSSASSDTVFTGNTISNTGVIPVSGGGAAIRLFGGNNTGINPSATFNIANNTMRDSLGTALAVNKTGGSGTFSGAVTGNTVGVVAVANSGSSEGSGIQVLTDGSGPYTASVTGNTVRQYGNFGIFMQTGGSGVVGSGAMNITTTGNTVSNPGTLVFIKNGVHLNGGVTPGDAYQICLSLGGAGALANSITGTGTDGGTDFRVRQRQSTTVRLPGYAGANNDDAAVVAFVQGNNDPVSTPTGSAANTVPTGGGFVGGAACPLP